VTLYEYLRRMPEAVPPWLEEFKAGEAGFQRRQFFASRVVYYPGSGTDGQPVKLFGSTHAAHSFVYADYGVGQSDIETQLADPARCFRGYHTLSRVRVGEWDLTPCGWIPHVRAADIPPNAHCFSRPRGFGYFVILERDPELGDSHGGPRLAVLFLGADGIAAYDALFCQADSPAPPFAVVLQDHGFGGNYHRFGQGGLVETIARQCHAYPPWLLVAANTRPWKGFVRVPGVEGAAGGMHATQRSLYARLEEEASPERGAGDHAQ
jgi:hypothetical protein